MTPEGARCLVINAATLTAECSGDLAAFEGGVITSHRPLEGLKAVGQLARLTRTMYSEHGWHQGPDFIVAVTGPGSFTGLRASLALANGLAFGGRVRLRGVTLGLAFRSRPQAGQAICVTRARRDRIFVERPDGTFWAGPPASFTASSDALLLGDGVPMVSALAEARLFATHQLKPTPNDILRAANKAADVDILEPFYIDAPEVTRAAPNRVPSERHRASPSA